MSVMPSIGDIVIRKRAVKNRMGTLEKGTLGLLVQRLGMGSCLWEGIADDGNSFIWSEIYFDVVIH